MTSPYTGLWQQDLHGLLGCLSWLSCSRLLPRPHYSIKYIVELRTFYSIVVGFAVGIYISFEFFPQAVVLQALIVLTMICTFVFIFTHFPSASSTKGLPWVFALLVALFPVTYLLEGQARSKSLINVGNISEEEQRLTTILAVERARTSHLGLYAAIFMLITSKVKFELTSLMREKALERGCLG